MNISHLTALPCCFNFSERRETLLQIWQVYFSEEKSFALLGLVGFCGMASPLGGVDMNFYWNFEARVD